ncbi:hypothetical protein ACVIJ6_002404 [Bradyrhizobium sp. USDA 4369]
MPELGRLVEIKGDRDHQEGTGFLIADGLILTGWHVLRPPPGDPFPSRVRVRLERDFEPRKAVDEKDKIADILWPESDPGDDLDFALLGLPASNGKLPPGTSVAPVRWASLGRWGQVEVTAVGYPDTAVDDKLERRETKGISGLIQLADNARALAEGTGLLKITLRDEDTPSEPAAKAWPAMSGAAVFAGEVLVGIIRLAGQELSRHRLYVVPIDRLFARDDVIAKLRATHYALPPRIDLDRTPSASAWTNSTLWNVPYLRNDAFAGREEIISRISAELNSSSARAVIQAIAGLGGIGKTQVALEYCYRYRDSYQIIWWVRAEDKKTRAADLKELGQRLGLAIDQNGETEQIQSTLQLLNQLSSWLLVFDNVEDPNDLTGLLPTAGHGHVIVTSRHASWAGVAKAITLDVWTRDETINYLINRTAQADTADNLAAAAELAEVLGRLPLAIEQAAAYIDETKIGLIEYTKLFSKHKLRLFQLRRPSRNRDEQSVAKVWNISIRRVERASPGAVALLKLCAFLRADQIAKEAIQKQHTAMPEPLRATAADFVSLGDAIAVLRRYSLVTATPEYISVHRLLQLVVRTRLSEREYRLFSELANRLEHRVDDTHYADEQPHRSLSDASLELWNHLFYQARTRRNFLISVSTSMTVGGIGFTLYRTLQSNSSDEADTDPASPPIVSNGDPFPLTWLAEVLRSAGLSVTEQPGWLNRGRGSVGPLKGVMCHHTAGPRFGNMPSLSIITNGRPDMPGPLAQLALGRDGTFFAIAAGRASHAGSGMWQGISTGNESFLGIQAENSGGPDDAWPAEQMQAYQRGVAAILRKIGADAIMCCGHKEYALPPGRKDDPSFDMEKFRTDVARILANVAEADETVPDLDEIAKSQGPIAAITAIAMRSRSARLSWRDRGIAPVGYIKGMAVVFARVSLKLKIGDPAAIDMAKANSGDAARDALAWYDDVFRAAGMDNSKGGLDTLRHLFVLLIGLGMRESIGRYCEGRDRAANSTDEQAEAGLFSSSLATQNASPLLTPLFQQYLARPSGFSEIFREGVTCTSSNMENFGNGAGKEFQKLSKERPAFAVEHAGVVLRNARRAYGPINQKKVEVRTECNAMLQRVQSFLETQQELFAELGVDKTTP